MIRTKKGKSIFAILLMLAVCLFAFCLCSCDNQEKPTHSWGSYISDGVTTHTRTCSDCNEKETKNHEWNDGVITKAATCKETGIKTFTCTGCGETKTETIEKSTVHSFGKWTSDGTTEHSRTCSVCGEKETEPHNMTGEVCGDCGYKITPASITSVENAEIDHTTLSIYMVVNKTVGSINLSNAVQVSDNSGWKLYTAGSSLIVTKFPDLVNGENHFLIVVSSADGLHENTYSLTIYKSFEVSLQYYDVYDNVIHTDTVDTGYSYAVSYVPDITGYTFNYWKLNGERTAEFIPFAATTLIPDCTANDYSISLDCDGGESEQTSKTVTFDSEFTLPVPTKTEHAFQGWYKDNTQITDDDGHSLNNSKFAAATTLTAKWKINTYTVTVESDGSSHGSVSGGGNYDYNSSCTVTATNVGYTFIGWYDGETKICDDLSYTFTVPAENVAYTAKWCKVTINTIGNCGVTKLDKTYVVGESLNVAATTYLGYDWDGWYDGETLLTANLNYTIIMPSEDITYTAKWSVKPEMQIFDFSSTQTTCTITQLKDKTLSEVVIPDYVTGIGGSDERNGAFSGCSNLASIEIPSGVTSIGTSAFCDCSSLASITFAAYSELLQINSYAFNGCSKLASIEIPNGVHDIGDYAFSSCSGLKSVTFAENNWLDSIKSYAFNGCSNLASIEIPNCVTSIGANAFEGCSSLASVTFTENSWLCEIDSYAFSGCSGLTSVKIPKSVMCIPSYAFNGCSRLTSVTFAENSELLQINSYAFSGCSNLASIEIPDGVRDIGDHAFSGCSGLTSVKIPNRVMCIPSYAFNGCSRLTSVTFAENSELLQINSYAFSGCSNLASIEIPDGVRDIGDNAFSNCSNLASIEIPNGVHRIAEYAFSGCSGLTSIKISESVMIIDANAFKDCSKLETIYYKGTETEYRRMAVDSTNNEWIQTAKVYFNS